MAKELGSAARNCKNPGCDCLLGGGASRFLSMNNSVVDSYKMMVWLCFWLFWSVFRGRHYCAIFAILVGNVCIQAL